MLKSLQLLVLPLFCLLANTSFSQTNFADIRPLLKSLTHQQKLQALEYLRHQGADMDAVIQFAYDQLPKYQQTNSLKLIESFKQSKKQEQLASVYWERDTVFFNDLPEGTVLLDSFRVTNSGGTPYSIASVKSTCDCAVLNPPQHPIMPGESAILRIQFDSSGKLGTATPAIILYDNSTPNKRHILYLSGNIVARKKPRKYPWED